MLGHEDKLHFGHPGFELPAGVESVQPGHGNVQYNDVGLQFGRRFQKCTSVAHRAHNLASGLQNALQRIHQHLMVIRQ